MKIVLHYLKSGTKEEYDNMKELLEVLGNRIEDGSYEGRGPMEIYEK